jgi:hypothetical protein
MTATNTEALADASINNELIIVATLEEAAFFMEDGPTVRVLIDAEYCARRDKQIAEWVAPELLLA